MESRVETASKNILLTRKPHCIHILSACNWILQSCTRTSSDFLIPVVAQWAADYLLLDLDHEMDFPGLSPCPDHGPSCCSLDDDRKQFLSLLDAFRPSCPHLDCSQGKMSHLHFRGRDKHCSAFYVLDFRNSLVGRLL